MFRGLDTFGRFLLVRARRMSRCAPPGNLSNSFRAALIQETGFVDTYVPNAEHNNSNKFYFIPKFNKLSAPACSLLPPPGRGRVRVGVEGCGLRHSDRTRSTPILSFPLPGGRDNEFQMSLASSYHGATWAILSTPVKCVRRPPPGTGISSNRGIRKTRACSESTCLAAPTPPIDPTALSVISG